MLESSEKFVELTLPFLPIAQITIADFTGCPIYQMLPFLPVTQSAISIFTIAIFTVIDK